MIHTGTSIFPGARNVHAQPILCDDIGVDFPDLPIILAHGGRPLWMAEAFFLVRRHKNFHMDICGIPPQKLLEYFPRIEDIANKVLWGTDWPSPGVNQMQQNVAKFEHSPTLRRHKAKNPPRQRSPTLPPLIRNRPHKNVGAQQAAPPVHSISEFDSVVTAPPTPPPSQSRARSPI